MQRIDPHTLFSIFEQGDEEIYKEHAIEDAFSNPFVLMGTIIRGVDNYFMMDTMYLKRYPKEYKPVRKITKYKYLNKLYGYLTRIDSLNFKDMYKVGETFEGNEAFGSLDVLRKYFESIEHYEKCAIIVRFQDLLKKSQLQLI